MGERRKGGKGGREEGEKGREREENVCTDGKHRTSLFLRFNKEAGSTEALLTEKCVD